MSNSNSSRRYWNGSPGDRHEPQNVWVVGGRPQVTRARTVATESVSNGSSSSSSSSDALAATAYGARRVRIHPYPHHPSLSLWCQRP